MITYKYLDSEKSRVGKFVNGENVGGGLVADSEFQQWLAEGNTPEPYTPTPAELNAPILAQLAVIDQKKVRAMTDGILKNDKKRLEELEAEAEVLRAQLV